MNILSREESYSQTLSLYQYWARLQPDLFEPYALALDNANANPDRQAVMRQALRETFDARFPITPGVGAA